MKRKVLGMLLVVSMVGTMLAGCGTKTSNEAQTTGDAGVATSDKEEVASDEATTENATSGSAKKFKVGFAQKTLENEFQTALADGVKKAGEAKGWEVTVLDAKNDIINEQTNMETFISQDYDLIYINVVDTEAATASIEAAVDAGIPVIAIDSHVEDGAPVVTRISAPDRENGRAVGLYAATQYDKKDKIKAAVLSGNKGNPGGKDRRVGEFCGIIEGRTGCTEEEAWKLAETFEQDLTDNGKAVNEDANFEIVAQGWGNWTTDEGLPAMEDILVANGDINCLLGENDSMLIGGMQAIEDAGKTDQIQIFAAADAMKGALELIKEGGCYKATGLNNPTAVGEKAIEVGGEILEDGKDPSSYEATVTTEPICVNADNVANYYNPDSIF